jgi:hypothetical protein
MKRFARMAMAILGLGAVGFALSLVPPKSASGTAAANVNVINTSVPVGNPAGASGAVPLVTQGAEDLNGFAVESTCNFANFAATCSLNPLFTPPIGEIAVIEFVDSSCSVAPGTQAVLTVFYGPPNVTSAAGALTLPFNTSEAINLGNFLELVTARTVRAYAGNTAPMEAGWFTNTVQSQASFCIIDMAGHFVAAP